ncbi:MAG: acylphosphatase [Treponema sp.]|jgi:acylphosphatase|nr:acylphosphatase [Treponema sp.]
MERPGKEPRAAFSAQVEGRVQGVAFRYSCCAEACRLGLSGWVRNTPAGGVEVWAEGSREKLESFLAWLHRGPPGARVDRVKSEGAAALGVYRDFSII